MDKDGGKAKYNATNKAGAAYGVGYCDAQCPKDIKYIQGKANADWASGTCCAEIDLWEANKWATAFTAHPCNTTGNYKCTGAACETHCDKPGCDINPYRNGNKTFYGPSTSTNKFTVDTTQPFTVVTRFYTHNGLDNGTLVNITRYYIQNGKKIDNPQNNYSSATSPKYSHISDTSCKNQMSYFKAVNTFASHGAMARLNTSLTNGVVLVLSLWDDNFAKMLWLDSVYPVGGSTTIPGNLRGPCPTSSGDPNTLRNTVPNAYVKYSNIKFGKIGTTY